MKKISFLTVVTILLAATSTYSQDDQPKDDFQTIFGNKDCKVSHGGYMALTSSYSQVAGQNAFSLGGRAGWLIDHHITLGVSGQGFVNSIYNDDYDFPPDYNGDPVSGLYLVGGYGGFFVEPIIAPNFPVHIAIPVMIGGGAAAWNYTTWWDYDWEDEDYYDFEPYDYDAFFVVEPGLEIELNLVKFMRASFGVTYRYVTDLQLDGTPKDAMNGFTGNFSLKFGKF